MDQTLGDKLGDNSDTRTRHEVHGAVGRCAREILICPRISVAFLHPCDVHYG